VTETGTDVAKVWDTDQPFAADEAFRAMVKNNRKIKNYREWTSWRHDMSGKAGEQGIVELGFKAAGKAYRVLCVFNGKLCIVVLCLAYHKGSVWTPTKAVETATKRAKVVNSGKAELNVIQDEDNLEALI